MGGCLSAVDRVGKAKSGAIDKQIEEDKKKDKKECKVLLLGELFILSVLGQPPLRSSGVSFVKGLSTERPTKSQL